MRELGRRRQRVLAPYRGGLWSLFVLLAAQPAWADDDEPLEDERFEGLTIERFEIEAPPREDVTSLTELSGIEVGRAFRHEDVRAAIRVLFRTGRFEDVKLLARREGNSVAIRAELAPRLWIRELAVTGDEGLVDAALVEQALGVSVGDPVQTDHFRSWADKLEDVLARRGYHAAAVGLGSVSRDENGGLGLVARINAGPVTRVRKLVLEGRPRQSAFRIREALGVVEEGVLDLEHIEARSKDLLADYRARGYYEAKISPPKVVRIASDPDFPIADLVISIDAGPQIAVFWTGSEVFRKRELDRSLEVLEEIGLSREVITEIEDSVLARYQRRGYWKARVDAIVRATPDGAKKEVWFRIREGRPVRVGVLRFPGQPNIPEISEALLEEKVEQVVSQSLGTDAEGAGANQAAISELLGDRPAHRLSHADVELEPEPRRVYLKKAYAEATQAIADLYRDQGYLAAEVGPAKVTERVRVGGGTELAVEMPIRAGVRWLLGSVSFRGNEVVDALDLFDLAGKVQIGATLGAEPLSFYRVEEARRVLENHYRDLGHLFVKVEQHYREVTARGSVASSKFSESPSRALSEICLEELRSASTSCEVELVFRIQEGSRATVRKIRPPIGAESTRESLVRNELTLFEGDVLSAAELRKSERNLLRLGVFSKVSVHPLDPDTEEPTKDVVVEVTEKKPVAVEVGAGLSTEEGVRVFAGLTHSNVLGRAIRAQANARANVQPFLFLYSDAIRGQIETLFAERPVEYALSVGLDYPHILGLPRGFGAGVDVAVLQDNDPAFREDARTVTLGFSYKGLRPELLGHPRPIGLQLRLGFEWSDLRCNELAGFTNVCGANADPGRRSSGTAIYASIRPSISFDLRDDALDPRLGLYVEARPEMYFGFNEDSPDLLDLRAKLNGYLPLPLGTSLAVSLMTWRIVPFPETAPIPVNRRYFAGGRSTIRGYQEQTLFPADVASDVSELSPGGLLFFALKSEVRIPISEAFAVAPFVDVGDLFADPKQLTLSDATRRAAGVGLRYQTPIGPLLLDFGFPFAPRRLSEVAWTIHFAAVGSF
ncbi:MAG: BamA/TamA family outer membrane protein [Deltaproteobacteria bacterium]|nr:BamA/TamA family outer membrane protein [Deltaproteobacteria bacterium]